MDFTESFGRCLRDGLDFGGRASRSEYWWSSVFLVAVTAVLWVILMAVVAGVVLLLLALLLLLESPVSWVSLREGFAAKVLLLPTIMVLLYLLLQYLAMSVRRLHDVNRSGWWILLPWALGLAGIFVAAILGAVEPPLLRGEIPVLGWLGFAAGSVALFVFLVMPGSLGPNRHGPDPRPPVDARAWLKS